MPHKLVFADEYGLQSLGDGSFIETTSALAARELKKLYDHMSGVGKGKTVRSPYAITAMEHNGKKVFRVRWVSACLLPSISATVTSSTTHPHNPRWIPHLSTLISVSSKGYDGLCPWTNSYTGTTRFLFWPHSLRLRISSQMPFSTTPQSCLT